MSESQKFDFAKPQFKHIPTDEEIIVPVSGGKDSTAAFILALQHFEKDKIIPLHYNTGWDHPKTYDYLKYIQDKSGIEVQHTIAKDYPTMIDYIRHELSRGKGFPHRMARYCTRKYKRDSIKVWFKENGFYENRKAECWLGIRSDESHQRKKKYGDLDSAEIHSYRDVFPDYPKALDRNISLRFPVIDWATQDCFDYIEKYGWKQNPLYKEGSNRVGCYPCLLASKKKQTEEFNTEFGQKQLKFIRDLEKEFDVKYEMYDEDQGSCEVCNI